MDEQMTEALARAIGERVKRQRELRGWTLDQLSDAAGIGRRTLVNVEQGAANPSVATLLRLSDALGVGLPTLVEPPATQAIGVTRAGEGATLWTGDGGGRGVMVAAVGAPQVVELWDWTLAPGDRHDSEAHRSGARELVHVLEGAVRVEAAGQSTVLEVGDAAAFPGDVAHGYANAGDVPARFALTVFEPGGTPGGEGS